VRADEYHPEPARDGVVDFDQPMGPAFVTVGQIAAAVGLSSEMIERELEAQSLTGSHASGAWRVDYPEARRYVLRALGRLAALAALLTAFALSGPVLREAWGMMDGYPQTHMNNDDYCRCDADAPPAAS
jgi:hypothetical protein